ncbi:hypothetical protein EA848_25405 [Vibrio anguillarum]|uniref:Uncharacterized protein n=1 Tax=Vibrio anguillarum TaxID=55601 RepID=A0A7U6FS50_VIBAN|nr:hypothetical protein [Vibrio anguillarum]AZS26312.1 hypothetical protein DYL72_15500 [Vibrio anguillarum]MBF4374456.1 hypothetical protein [Vibrio anguillarum]MBF4432852.1 hypothetical protein [Vibrio anguillarum]MBF4436912.1 hypothetical protein [Vibrio anguillarum]
MRKTLCLLAISLASFCVNAAMTEEECKPQAMTISTILAMVENGSIPENEDVLAKLNKAEKHIQNGEFCAARSIIINLSKQ